MKKDVELKHHCFITPTEIQLIIFYVFLNWYGGKKKDCSILKTFDN